MGTGTIRTVGMQLCNACTVYAKNKGIYGSMDMDISMDAHAKSVDMDMYINAKFHIHGKPD